MGCDIHIITEIRKDGKWQWVKEIPESFDSRNYVQLSIFRGPFEIAYIAPPFLVEVLPMNSELRISMGAPE